MQERLSHKNKKNTKNAEKHYTCQNIYQERPSHKIYFDTKCKREFVQDRTDTRGVTLRYVTLRHVTRQRRTKTLNTKKGNTKETQNAYAPRMNSHRFASLYKPSDRTEQKQKHTQIHNEQHRTIKRHFEERSFLHTHTHTHSEQHRTTTTHHSSPPSSSSVSISSSLAVL